MASVMDSDPAGASVRKVVRLVIKEIRCRTKRSNILFAQTPLRLGGTARDPDPAEAWPKLNQPLRLKELATP